MMMLMLLAGVSSSAAMGTAITHVVLDASNLQLGLRPGGATLALSSLDVSRLHERHNMMVRTLGSGSEVRTMALFDGSAFNGEYAGDEWECDPEAPDAAPVCVRFTDKRVSADDAVVAFAQEIGGAAESPGAEAVSSGSARATLEQDLPEPRPVFAATLLKSAMGKGKRDKREAFLRTCGLMRMGDTVHLPAYDEKQQERALALVRGLHKFERGVIRMEVLRRPAAIVVSDDRGLRRRCFSLASPPVVLGRKQWENWLQRCDLPGL